MIARANESEDLKSRELLATSRATCLLIAMSSQQPALDPHDEAEAPRDRILRYRRNPLLDPLLESTPTWTGTATMEAHGPWNEVHLNVHRRARAEVTFALMPEAMLRGERGALFEATGTVTYSATGTGFDCTLDLPPTTLPVIGYLQFVPPALPSPVYVVSGGAAGLLDHMLSRHNKPSMVISMEPWPWLVVPFNAAPTDAAALAGALTVGDATYTWAFARNPPPGSLAHRRG